MPLTEELQVIAPAKLNIENVTKDFTSRRGTVRALENVSLTINEGEFVCTWALRAAESRLC